MSTEIKVVTSEDDVSWDAFVHNHPDGGIYHHSSWREVLELSYGYQPVYVALCDTSTADIRGILPFMLVQSSITGDRLVSLPFSSYCAPLVPDGVLEEMVHFVLTRHPQVEYLELKLAEAGEKMPEFLARQSEYITHSIDLTIGEEALLRSFHHSSVRQRIVRAQRSHLTVRLGENEEELKEFFKLHTAVRKKHGLPPHPYKFFYNMWKIMAPKRMLLLPYVEYQGRMVAAAVALKYKDVLFYEYSASDERFLTLSANQLLVWEVIRLALGEGMASFDFGRSSLTNPSLIQYKDRWGAKRRPLNYYYYPETQKVGTEGSLGRRVLNRANRYLPNALLQLEGEFLYRHLG